MVSFDPSMLEGDNPFAYMSGMTPAQFQGTLNNDLITALRGNGQDGQPLGPYQNLEQYIDYGGKPVAGMVYKGSMAPGIPGMPNMSGTINPYPTEGADKPSGSWQFIGNYDNGNRNPDHGSSQVGQWQYVEAPKQAAAAAPMQAQEEKPLPTYPEGDIYNDWDYAQKRGRADVEGINKMPYTYSDYATLSLRTPEQNTNTFYPGAWQEEGVQKVIGPNGQNIAPKLQEEGLLSLFRDGGVNTANVKDWPSMLDALLGKGAITKDQGGFLAALTKPKTYDQSFANSSMIGMK